MVYGFDPCATGCGPETSEPRAVGSASGLVSSTLEVLNMSKGSNPHRKSAYMGSNYADRTDYEGRIGELIKPQPDGCWHFTGGTNGNGYGVVWSGYDEVLAHRYVYDTLVPEGVPDDMVLHHECEVKYCVNPAHLTPMTRADHTSHHRTIRAAIKAA